MVASPFQTAPTQPNVMVEQWGGAMVKRWAGFVVTGDKAIMVDAEVPDTGPIVVQSDRTFSLQAGDREPAYSTLFHQIADYLVENKVEFVVVKASAVAKGSGLAHLLSAEVRGVVMAASAGNCTTRSLSKAKVSKSFGKRKADEYIADASFWDEQVKGGSLRSGSREAALLLLSERDRL